MALQKHAPPGGTSSVNMKPLSFTFKKNVKVQPTNMRRGESGSDLEVDLKEVYFLIMHFMSAGPCQRASGQLWNELLEHQLLPRRYHAWYSRNGGCSGHEDADGMTLPLSYTKLVERGLTFGCLLYVATGSPPEKNKEYRIVFSRCTRDTLKCLHMLLNFVLIHLQKIEQHLREKWYPHVEKDHLVKLLKQLMLNAANPAQGLQSANALNAASVPTFLGTGYFSLLSSEQHKRNNEVNHPPGHMRWPHMKADQVRGLSLREIGGGFSRHHRAPSIHAASYAIAKPSTLVQKMQNRKRVRGHRSAVYCSIFDRSGRYVITGSDDRLVKIWSMETAFCLASCRGHEGDITDLAVSFNNAMVASASNDCIIRVWRLYDGMPISVLRGHTGAVTAIAFSPRPSSPGHLLSSSDDGTCRIWEARYSQLSPRVYIPKPADATPGKNNCPSSSTTQQTHQIFCCAFNASGTVFVTGSSDTLARVWNACKLMTPGDLDQPIHELDVLSGHENDVNYVQFSGCAVPCRFSSTDATKDVHMPKFKNMWYNQDNIVTCSRDGSAIIWIPKSRRSHGKAGRWTRAYHLKVPPPPMPPQPPRGGPRQRILPTPRGVNMIVWSLDNRFVLAAIMDCRICVWNAADGRLVHCLTGHSESTYVLDVHPFNPRIAMSAGYDGKTIVWDIWEGVPVCTYDIGRFKLVDGKFSPDGTSIILSDDVGQLYILTTGQGESQKDAKYDQFFLGDYRPLVQDTHGNVQDQETQLIPYRRNMQDLLCDSGMIPYPEPYQSVYQKRRLGALGIEWHPSSFRFAVGTDISLDLEYQMPPIADLDLFLDPLPEFMDAMDWEPEIDIQSEDADSEYHVPEEYSSAGEQAGLDSGSSSDPESSENNGEAEDPEQDGLRRSKRKKLKSDVEVTSSGRHAKRSNLDECGEGSFIYHRARKSKVRKASRKRLSSSKSSRPQRAAARNALHLFSRITGTSTDDDDEEEYSSAVGDSSESESVLEDTDAHSDESKFSMLNEQGKHLKGKEILVDKSIDIDKLDQHSVYRVNAPVKRRLILKFSNRDLNKLWNPHTAEFNGESQPSLPDQPSTSSHHLGDVHFTNIHSGKHSASSANVEIERSNMALPAKVENYLDLVEGYKDGNISWGGVKVRSSKRQRIGESMPVVAYSRSNAVVGHVKIDNCSTSHTEELKTLSSTTKVQNGEDKKHEAVTMDEQSPPVKILEMPEGTEHGDTEFFGFKDYKNSLTDFCQNADGRLGLSHLHLNGENNSIQLLEKPSSIPTNLRIISKTFSIDQDSRSNLEVDSVIGKSGQDPCDAMRENIDFEKKLDPTVVIPSEVEMPSSENLGHKVLPESRSVVDKTSPLLDLLLQPSQSSIFTAVYRRSKSLKGRSNFDAVNGNIGPGTSAASNPILNDTHEAAIEGARRTRSIRLSSKTHDPNVAGSSSKSREAYDDSVETLTCSELIPLKEADEIYAEEKRSGRTGTVGLRSARNRKPRCYARDFSPPERRKTNQFSRSSWLMMPTHEEGSRYIPQLGDEVVYLRQGHAEYIAHSHLRETGPWSCVKGNVRAVEFCKVEALEYSHLSGSGESCCKMNLRFIDPTSNVFGKSFKLTLPEVTSFPDFLVERSRYDASFARNWTFRDKCQVWWKNEGEENGSWWEGRIVTVKPKSSEFPDSPWEKYVVQYKSEPTETHQHSPWELYDSDICWELPHMDDAIRDMLLRDFAKLEQSGNKQKDYYGVHKLKEVSQKPCFINRFPVPLTLELIRSRLENNYYRSLEALEHDMKVFFSNAESYLGKNVEYSSKVRRLSEWLTRTLPS